MATALVLAFGIGASILGAGAGATADERLSKVAIVWPGGRREFTVEIADDVEERRTGLMNRFHLAPDAGMLFLFDQVRPVSFWMHDTWIPLDLLFIDAAGVVMHIAPNAVPMSEKIISSDGSVRAVLEINGGLAAKLGIHTGARVEHPAFAAVR